MKQLLTYICVAGLIHVTHAQFVVPDSAFTSQLQMIVPNAMTGNVLDTNHVDVVSLDSIDVSWSGIYDIDGIQFFDSLRILNCLNNELTSLPTLPVGLEFLNCEGNDLLDTLPTLPSTLKDLRCGWSSLADLPALPSSMVRLSCEFSMLSSLPSLPISLRGLECYGNSLTALPPLPTSLEYLNCSSNSLSVLPPLPASLETLICKDNVLTYLPPLPNIRLLLCEENSLTSLPLLPNSLDHLNCRTNSITALPVLPDSLVELHCLENLLTSIDSVPNTLEVLSCRNNLLTVLPTLPDSLRELYCGSNLLTSLPQLPGTLERLWCENNTLSCLPLLPDSLDILKCQQNQISCMPNFPVNLPPFGTSPFTQSTVDFDLVLCTPSDVCFPSQAISGVLFHDANGNGQLDFSEEGISSAVAMAQPGNQLSGVDSTGHYGIPVSVGNYVVQGQPLQYHSITTGAHSVMILAGTPDTAKHIGYTPIPGIHDLVVDIHSGVARPGFNNNIWLEVRNIGTEPTTASIDLDFDAVQSYVGSSITPASQSGTMVNWSVAMNPGDIWNATVTLNTPPTATLLGTPIDHLFSAFPTMTDTTPADNSANWNDIIVGSYDPNDKTASDSVLTPTQVMAGEWIEYLIRFQNTGTFMAEHVRITDTLPDDLQWGTFEYISSSHDNYWYLSNGTLVFQFDNIQLPDSNTNEPDSHGFVKFRIKADPNLTVGDSIVNVANIYFDFNEPVITDPSVVLIDVSSGVEESMNEQILLFPNPTSGELNILSDQMVRSLELYSSDGRLLMSESVNATSHRIDVSGLERGMYVLEFTTATGRMVRRVIAED